MIIIMLLDMGSKLHRKQAHQICRRNRQIRSQTWLSTTIRTTTVVIRGTMAKNDDRTAVAEGTGVSSATARRSTALQLLCRVSTPRSMGPVMVKRDAAKRLTKDVPGLARQTTARIWAKNSYLDHDCGVVDFIRCPVVDQNLFEL